MDIAFAIQQKNGKKIQIEQHKIKNEHRRLQN
jgi:hypothetical protein